MKKKFIYIFTILAFMATGCNEDYLNRLPLDEIADETFWNTEEQLILASNGCYANIKAKIPSTWKTWATTHYGLPLLTSSS